jgi:hypothetical protein
VRAPTAQVIRPERASHQAQAAPRVSAGLPHLAGYLGVARLVRIPQVAAAEAREVQEDRQKSQDQEVSPEGALRAGRDGKGAHVRPGLAVAEATSGIAAPGR